MFAAEAELETLALGRRKEDLRLHTRNLSKLLHGVVIPRGLHDELNSTLYGIDDAKSLQVACCPGVFLRGALACSRNLGDGGCHVIFLS